MQMTCQAQALGGFAARSGKQANATQSGAAERKWAMTHLGENYGNPQSVVMGREALLSESTE